MTVKMMSADQIRDDLETIQLTWPDGVPWQQADRVKALRNELKRRDEPIERPAGSTPPSYAPSNARTTEELETELRALSTRSDERSQERFADVRFELRRRAKELEASGPVAKPRSSVVPRELELPDDESESGRVVPRKPTPSPPQENLMLKKAPAPLKKKSSASVCGFSATAREDGTMLVEYENAGSSGVVTIRWILELADAGALCAMLSSASVRAAELASDG